MTNSYIVECEGTVTLNLVNHLVFIDDNDPENITISSLNEQLIEVTISKKNIFKISKFTNKNYPICPTINLNKENKIQAEIHLDWIVIRNNDYQVALRPEMFKKIVDYLEWEKNNERGK